MSFANETAEGQLQTNHFKARDYIHAHLSIVILQWYYTSYVLKTSLENIVFTNIEGITVLLGTY